MLKYHNNISSYPQQADDMKLRWTENTKQESLHIFASKVGQNLHEKTKGDKHQLSNTGKNLYSSKSSEHHIVTFPIH